MTAWMQAVAHDANRTAVWILAHAPTPSGPALAAAVLVAAWLVLRTLRRIPVLGPAAGAAAIAFGSLVAWRLIFP